MEKLALALSLIGVGFLALMLLLRRFFLPPEDAEDVGDITWEHVASREAKKNVGEKGDEVTRAA
ncbi:MAG: hypothetical protein MUC38_15845 [Cyclobacteriaceae bacterium]|jgi:hypothetical protein|nr:hypothetical protein [Cyclobacteriaceae bacterium]